MVNARTNQVFEKIAKVNERWAKDFSGKPLICMTVLLFVLVKHLLIFQLLKQFLI